LDFDLYLLLDDFKLHMKTKIFNTWAHNGYIVSPYRDMSGIH